MFPLALQIGAPLLPVLPPFSCHLTWISLHGTLQFRLSQTLNVSFSKAPHQCWALPRIPYMDGRPRTASLNDASRFVLLSLSSTDHAPGQPNTCYLSHLSLTKSHAHLTTTKHFIAAMTMVLTSITLGTIQVTGGFILKNTNWNNFEMQREILITRLCTKYTAFRILPYSLC